MPEEPDWKVQKQRVEQWQKEVVDSVLQFKGIATAEEDWDNIPSFVARSIIHFEKYIKGLSAVCAEIMGNQSTPELRKDILEKIDETVDRFDQKRERDLYEMKILNQTADGL